jgi:UDP-N-acetylmuramoyl-tripeptide--D-alanyl-D-alanine ligase
MILADVFEALLNVRPSWAGQVTITDVVVDSRQVTTGSLFVALQGETHDGHEFVGDALARGAVVVLAEERVKGSGLGPSVRVVKTSTGVAGLQPGPEPLVPTLFIVPSTLKALHDLAAYWRRRFPSCKITGVTGSIGKSSTKELIASVLAPQYVTLKSKGNLNNEIGLPLTLLKLNETHQRAVLEMGMYAIGEIRELCRLAQPSIGVITNVGPSHLERLGSIERIAQAKGELVQALPADGVAVLNGDDALVRRMRDWTSASVLFYGLDPSNDIRADEIESFGLEGIAFDLHYRGEKLHVRLPLLGRHSVHTALAAAGVGLADGLSWDQILSGLRDVSAQLRLIAVPAEKETTILDDTYNSSPESSLAALNLLAELDGRKIAVLGDMLELGTFEEEGHRIVGGRAAQVVAVLVAVGTRGKWIGAAAQEDGLAETFFAESNNQAVEILRGVMRPGDMILVKGSRGARMEEIVSALARGGENGEAEHR